jgi:TRAP-type C4-dicarboxylate transport system substrate-binding protein
MVRRLVVLSLAALWGVLLWVSAAASAQVEWNLASRLAEGVFHTWNLRLFAKDVEETTRGQLKITIHATSSLFRHPEIKRAVKSAQVEAGTLQISSFANEDEIFNFDCIPFLATTYYENLLLWEAASPIFSARMMKEGIRVLWAEPWPPQAFYAKMRVAKVSDFKGVKFRTYNKIGSRTAELMGAHPVLIEASEVPQAFSTGMVQAMVTSSSFGASVQAWDFVKYFHDVGAWFGYDETIVNERAFQKLKPEVQTAVLEAARRAEVRGWVMSYEANELDKQRLVSNGMEIIKPSPQFMDELKTVTKVQTEEWVKAAGEDARKIIARYNELKGRK